MQGAAFVTQEVQALERLDLEGLRAVWRGRWGAPPRLRSADLLRHLIAWRLQAAVCGGLDADTRRRLRAPAKGPEGALRPGQRLAREWLGRRHEVEVGEDGFVYQGQAFASLSEIARTITGTRWNGPRFFGLREAQP